MTIPFWCLFAGCIIPFLLSASSGYFRVQQFGSADNKNPRAQQAALEGTGAREEKPPAAYRPGEQRLVDISGPHRCNEAVAVVVAGAGHLEV